MARSIQASVTAAMLLVGCGGDDGGAPPAAPAPVEAPSAGGVWGSIDNESPTLFIAEDGDLRFAASAFGFGDGSVAVSADGSLSGTLRRVLVSAVVSASALPPPIIPSVGSPAQSCTVTGRVIPRTTLSATFVCASPGGPTTTQSLSFLYVAPAHAGPSSSDGLAGNYTLSFRAASNMLNVNANGEVFAMYDNGWRCTMNGRFSVIDPRFNLYRAEWTASACDRRSASFEGARFTGLAQRAVGTSMPGSIYVLLTATIQGQLSMISVLYDPP